ncbi:DNA-binding transcriptional ArsR family regulator [Rubricella aquisinus]|uniref:DNA-binding transcriptional ArsR family regulator n=1 Tax=Rubricella aquisinus TaxID=2028108 RepID=A0A840X5E8_9RHOB|nr:metalloregulator ArsR/SmtB family transcription factor [Rubricella aquisinus]MBB5517016.1 DNA-binding transcriptional ArsR family regulator [Rubricella aquisinus]
MVDDSTALVILNRMVDTSAHLDTTFAALADPTRRAILARLLESDAPVNALADPFEMSLAAVSKHLTILARAGLIVQEKRGREKWCRLDPDAIAPAALWMESFGQIALSDLDALERFIADELTG